MVNKKDWSSNKYDNHMQTKVLTVANMSDFSYKYIVYLTEGRYYLRSAYVDTNDYGVIDFAIGKHREHQYLCTPVNDTYHILKCKCGNTSGTQSLHTLKFESGFGNYKQCTGCGILVNTGGTGICPVQPYENTLIEECFLY